MSLTTLRQKLISHAASVFAFDATRRDALSLTVLDLMRGERVTDERLISVCAPGVSGDVEGVARGEDVSAARAAKLARPIIVPGGSNKKATAIISFRGVVLYDYEYQPYAVSSLLFSQTIDALVSDDSVGTIIVDMDSPGGIVTGVKEAADSLFAARESGKQVIVLINPLSASAGYWVASQASEIIGVPSCDVGSIGVFMLHLDFSKLLADSGIKPTFIYSAPYKVEGNAFEPLSDETRAQWQMECDAVYADFTAAVARGREIDVAKVLADFGQGRTKTAPDAKRVGMIDRIDTIAGAFRRAGIVVADGNSLRRAEVENGGTEADAVGEASEDAASVELVDVDPAAAPVDREGRMGRRLALARHDD